MATKAIMRALGFANGVPCPIAGQWLMSFDHEAHNGRGDGVFTDNPRKAMRFDNAGELMEFWKRTSKVRPLRDDFRPNKPLTATTVTIDYIDE